MNVCAEPGCPDLTAQRYCDQHRRAQDVTRAKRRTFRGSLPEWKRRKILNRDKHRCRYCGAEADQVDHVTPRDAGGTDDEDNLVAACADCNNRKGPRPVAYLHRH